jgi:methylenetetrahydrofolate reductase (NADPH)
LEAGIEPILQFTCRDRNRIALQSELMSAAAIGIRNLLILRGDNPEAGDQPDAKPVFDLDTRELLKTARLLREKNELPSGRRVRGAAPFLLGAADNPIDPPPGWEPKGLLAKIEAGAQFSQTQFCMDPKIVRKYMLRLAEHGITSKLSTLIGIVPLRSAKSARWIKEKLGGAIIPDDVIERMESAANPSEEGRRICLELIAELATIPHVAGCHIMAPGNDSIVPGIISAARDRMSQLVPA